MFLTWSFIGQERKLKIGVRLILSLTLPVRRFQALNENIVLSSHAFFVNFRQIKTRQA
jgi:hypothetical protein